MITKEKTIFSISYTVLELLPVEISPLGGDSPSKHYFFAYRSMQICLYPYKCSTLDTQNWFLGDLKGKESKSTVKIAEKQHFHGENKRLKIL